MKIKSFLFGAVLLTAVFVCLPAGRVLAQTGCYTFNTDYGLGYANSGTAEVGYLHADLEKEMPSISYAPDTGNIYSTGTAKAVSIFQAKYGISATGYVGIKTKTKLNALYGCSATSASVSAKSSTPTVSASATTIGITVTSSNGGDSWKTGEVHPITWTAGGVANVDIKVRDYTNSASPVDTNITTVSSTGSYSWTVPSTLSGNYFKLVIAGTGSDGKWYTDFSDNYFSINSTSTIHRACQSQQCVVVAGSGPDTCSSNTNCASVVVAVNPSSGSSFSQGQNMQVLYGCKSICNANWIWPQTYLMNSSGGLTLMYPPPGPVGSFTWFIPLTTPTGEYKLLFKSDDNKSVWGYSDTFTIQQGSYLTCANQKCVAVAGSGTNQCSTDSNCVMASHNECVNQKCASVSGAGTSSCTTDTDCTSAGQSITVTSPRGGEMWSQTGMLTNTTYPASYIITWTSTGMAGKTANIYFMNGLGQKYLVASNVSATAGIYTWNKQLPSGLDSYTGGAYKVYISSGAVSGMSNGYFTIMNVFTSWAQVGSPNGGQTWQTGTANTISWSYQAENMSATQGTKCTAHNDIYAVPCSSEYVCDPDKKIAIVTNLAPTTPYVDFSIMRNSYSFANNLSPLQVPAGQYKIEVYSTNCHVIVGSYLISGPDFGVDYSDGLITVSGSAPVCTPSWNCTVWTPSVCPSSGTQTKTCTDSNNCGTTTGKPATTQTCTYVPPVCTPSWNCTVWNPTTCPSSGTQTKTCTDSNNCGTTTGKPAETQSCTYNPGKSITITSPNGSELWQKGTTQRITWASTGFTALAKASISLVSPAGTTVIASNISVVGGAYSWVMPTTLTAGIQYKILVSSTLLGVVISDNSDNYFSITNPATPTCTPSWNCTVWTPSVCPSSGTQTKTCTDSNNCGTTTGKPAETQSCTYVPPVVDLTLAFGEANWTPLMGDWNGDGITTLGAYNPSTSVFYLRDTNTSGSANASFGFGTAGAGWLPIAGDWDGNGTYGVGLYDPSSSTFYLRNNNWAGIAQITLGFGAPGAGWLPIAGDWNNDGKTTIGLFDPSSKTFYIKNTNESGGADQIFAFNYAGLPITGDWDGIGGTTVGLYDSNTATFYLRNSNTAGTADVTLSFASSGTKPIAGDWTNQGKDSVGTYNPSTATYYLKNSATAMADSKSAMLASINDAINNILRQLAGMR